MKRSIQSSVAITAASHSQIFVLAARNRISTATSPSVYKESALQAFLSFRFSRREEDVAIGVYIATLIATL